MSDILFSFIIVGSEDTPGMRLTRKSIAMQDSLPPHEVICVSDGNMPAAMNEGLAKAQGRYVWFLWAGDAFSDMFVLRDVAHEIKKMPADFFFGDVRESGVLKPARPIDRLDLGMVTALQGMLFRRDLTKGLCMSNVLQQEYAYDFVLRFQDVARHIRQLDRLLADSAPSRIDRREIELVRRELMRIPDWENKWLSVYDRILKRLKR